jgi:arsenic resistance protein ArsH
MNILIFNGSADSKGKTTSDILSSYFKNTIEASGHAVTTFSLSEVFIPFLNLSSESIPESVQKMVDCFMEADAHIWISPLYHGSIPGMMKNCLDWLEITRNYDDPYLTGKVIGLVCYADGIQAMQGINTMDAVAKALRAWVLPLAVPVSKQGLYNEDGSICTLYGSKFRQMVKLLLDTEEQVKKLI